jgi:hypothetical protein
MTWVRKSRKFLSLALILMLIGPLVAVLTGMAAVGSDWRTASREPLGIAPDPATTPEAIIQVYGARAYGWRGALAVHTWISAKRENGSYFVTYEVIGWHHWGGRPAVASRTSAPDKRWFGSDPEIYAELRGPEVEALIDRLEEAVANYAFRDHYRTWPGPNSNTFTAMMGRALPELHLDLPPTAVGKDFIANDKFLASSPSGTGFQLSLFGLVGIMLAKDEGLEINILGLSLGIDPLDLAIKLPGIGRLEPSFD